MFMTSITFQSTKLSNEAFVGRPKFSGLPDASVSPSVHRVPSAFGIVSHALIDICPSDVELVREFPPFWEAPLVRVFRVLGHKVESYALLVIGHFSAQTGEWYREHAASPVGFRVYGPIKGLEPLHARAGR